MQTTIGIPILVVLLHLLTHAFLLTPIGDPPESIQSGNYGRPPRTKWWLKQSFIYFFGLLGMKFCVFLIFQICPWIVRVGNWALRWTEGNDALQIFFVMLFFPVIMNALQYYIIDSFIKQQKPQDHEPIPGEDGEDDGVDEHGQRGEVGDGTGEVTLNEGLGDKTMDGDKTQARVKSKNVDEYDPAIDGERSGSVGETDNPRSRLTEGSRGTAVKES